MLQECGPMGILSKYSLPFVETGLGNIQYLRHSFES